MPTAAGKKEKIVNPPIWDDPEAGQKSVGGRLRAPWDPGTATMSAQQLMSTQVVGAKTEAQHQKGVVRGTFRSNICISEAD